MNAAINSNTSVMTINTVMHVCVVRSTAAAAAHDDDDDDDEDVALRASSLPASH